jgi:hypothetical protein
MGTNGTLGAALSTAIWAAIAGAAWARSAQVIADRHALRRGATWLADAAGLLLIVLVPQGLRLWCPGWFVQHYFPHTLTTAELALLVRIAGIAGLIGIGVAQLYHYIGKRRR